MFGRKFDKGLLGGILASLAIHAGGGYEVDKIYKEVTHERMAEDRERVKDVIFLPLTQEELVQNLLEQAGVKTLEEIQKKPELARKIDSGKFFIQVEFLEKKIDAKTAKKAILNLQLKREVFKNLFDKTQDPLLVLNEIQNEISDPQLFVDKDDQVENKKVENDYKKGEALISSYLIHGQSNCYASLKSITAIAQVALPNTKLKINELDQHVRIIAEHANRDYIIDPGTEIIEATEKNLGGTIVYDNDAQLSFLSGLLHLPNPNKYIDGEQEHKEELQKPDGNIQTDNKKYKRTSIGNYFDYAPTSIQNRLKLKTYEIEIPNQADRKRVQLPAKLDLNGEKKYNKQEISKLLKISTRAAKTDILSVEQKKQEAEENTKEERTTAKDVSKVKLGNESETNFDASSPADTSPTKKIEFVLLEAEPMIDAFIRESLDDPKKEKDNSNEIMLWLKKLDENGQLETYTKQHAQEVKKLETLRPKPGEKAGSYLQAKFLVADYIKKYYEFKGSIDEKKLLEDTEETLLQTIIDANELPTGIFSNPIENNPVAFKRFGIKDMPKVLKKIEDILKKSKKDYSLFLSSLDNAQDVKKVLEIAENYPPDIIELSGNFQHLKEVQQFLDDPKMKGVRVVWQSPPNGTSLKPIWKAIEEGRVRAHEDHFDAKEKEPSQFSMIDRETKTIVDVNTPELRDKFGKDYIIEYFIRKALAYKQAIKLEMKNKIFFPKSGVDSFGIQDFEILSQKIQRFANEGQTKRMHKYLFGGQRHMAFPDDLVFNFIEQLDLAKIAKSIPKRSFIEIFDTHITNFPTDNISCDEMNLRGASFGDIPSDFLTKNKNIKFGLIASGLNIDNYFSDKRIDTFLKKISGAEMDDILITDRFVETNDHLNNNKTMVLHYIEIKTNTNGWENAEENYSFKIEINLGKEYGIGNVINNILNRIKTKKVFFGEGVDLGLKQSIEKNHPQITFDDSDFAKRESKLKTLD